MNSTYSYLVGFRIAFVIVALGLGHASLAAQPVLGWWVNNAETELYQFGHDGEFKKQDLYSEIQEGAWQTMSRQCGNLFTYLGDTHCCYEAAVINNLLILQSHGLGMPGCEDKTLRPASEELIKQGLVSDPTFRFQFSYHYKAFAGWTKSAEGYSWEPCVRWDNLSIEEGFREIRLEAQVPGSPVVYLMDNTEVFMHVQRNDPNEAILGWDYQSMVRANTLSNCRRAKKWQKDELERAVRNKP